MATLGQLGVNGLVAVNSWIGMINSNLQGSSRTAFKPTRQIFLDGVVNEIGGGVQIPSATLKIQATTLEWSQGAIINSDRKTHFALSGEGFFVLVDNNGKYYLSRDGEFHWDGNGYLVNSAGLRVVSSGQDFIRHDKSDYSDIFSPDGQSQELLKYGNKSFLIVDVANRDGLRFSAYGSTVFELDGDLPLRVQNNLSDSMDGLTFIYKDPLQRTYVDAPDMPAFVTGVASAATNFTIDFGGNGLFDFQTVTGTAFTPNVNTIQDIVNAINLFGTTNNRQVSAIYDPDEDKIKITNIPEPKIADPRFAGGNFAIDFGANGTFIYPGFDPSHVTIQSILDAINKFGVQNNVAVSASFNPATDTFTINNNTGAGLDNQITFIGANETAMASFMKLPVSTASTGGGAHTVNSAAEIDRYPTVGGSTVNADITAADMTQYTLQQLIHPPSQIVFGGPNGLPLVQFFRLSGIAPAYTNDPLTGFGGSILQSGRDIDNSYILNNALAARQDLDILPGDVATKSILSYVTTSDTTVPTFDFSGPPAVYLHDKANSRVVSDGTLNAGHGLLAISQAETTDAFDIVLDYHTDSARLELNFGYSKPEQIDSGGFTLFYDPATGSLNLAQREKDPNKPPTVVDPRPNILPVTTGLGGLAHRLALTLDKDNILRISIDGSAVQSFNLAGYSQALAGYVSIGHQGNRLEIDNLYADFKGVQNLDATGALVSLSPTPYSNSDIRNDWQSRPRTQIMQSALETSTTSLTEYVPLLALAQKVFASISKIITVATSLDDDLNSLIR